MKTAKEQEIKFVFFGTSEFAVGVLEVLKKEGMMPSLVVTTEDKPKDRGLGLQPTPVKQWAEIHGITVFQPSDLKSDDVYKRLEEEQAELFIVASYGKLLPERIFELPPHKTLNVHPSLLPKLRGPAPIVSAILEGQETGVTIMLMSKEMDAGPILSQKQAVIPDMQNDPPRRDSLEELLAREGGELLVETIPAWISGNIKPREQDQNEVTYTKKIEKQDGLLNIFSDPLENLRKVRGYWGWPGAFMFFKDKNGNKVRVVVKEAEISNGIFTPISVVPEGKKEMPWKDFLRGRREL